MKIFLINGKLCQVDEDDFFKYIEGRNWCLNKGKLNYTWYIMFGERIGAKVRKVYLHRLIAGAKKGDRVSFISSNTLDCRKCNLVLNGRRIG